MKKNLLLLVLTLCPLWLMAAGNPGFGERGYRLTTMVEYSYNPVWSHHANLDVQALIPINPHFEMEGKVQLSTADVYTGAVQIRPKFEVPVGEIFLEADMMYRCVSRNETSDMTAALAIGYRMDYISVTIGSFSRILDDWNRDWHTDESYVVEPFNLMYRLEVFCRPQTNPWNLSFLFSNVDDYQMERMWQPLFGVRAYYDVVDHWQLNFGAQCKPTGMFHLDASFYGATLRAGFTYKF